MGKKKYFLLLLAGALLLWLALGERDEKPKSIQIGVSLYLENDTFVEQIVAAMQAEAAVYEAETGLNVLLNVSVANGSQRTQNQQVKRYIEMGYDAVCVNLVDRTSAAEIIDQASFEGEDVPIVFFNREPVEEDIMRRQLVYYVGSDAKQGAVYQGETIVECYQRQPEEMDKNGDGILQYVMLEGEMGHQDAIMRSDYSLQAITEAGLPLQKLASGAADWSRKRGEVLMAQWIDEYADQIELVICNNDDMALGALDSMEKAGLQAAVFGIDATAVGLAALEEGRLWATIDCNGEEQGRAVLRLAAGLAAKGELPEMPQLTEERYVRSKLEKRISPLR